MADLTAEKLGQLAFDIGLLDERQLQEAWGHFGRRNIPKDDLVQYLQRREYLTNWQAERLGKGEKGGYFCGDYKLLYSAGTGTFSRVYRAVHRHTGEMVAVKLLRRRYSDDAKQTEQFIQEGRMGKELRHPNIVPIFDVASNAKQGIHYIVMEFVEGQSLRDFVKLRKKVEPTEATRIMTGILTGLSYAFGRGVTHRDLKLTNVMLSSQAVPRLLDFGLAGVDDKSTIEGTDMPNPRTVDYVGLERASGVKKDDMRSDIFFVGCIFYHMLTGVPPLSETKDRIQRLSKTRFTDVTPISKVDPTLPKALAMIVTRAMEVTPSMRYQTPAEMLAELNVSHRRAAEAASAPESAGHDGNALQAMWANESPSQGPQKSLMVVESNAQMQEVLRNGLKRCGYRVLMTRDPHRALSRFAEHANVAECVLFSTLELGEEALAAFNNFGAEEKTGAVPAVLLLGEEHGDWVPKANVAEHRVVLTSPIKLKELRATLFKLVPPVDGAAKA